MEIQLTDLHIRLLKYYNLYTNEQEKQEQKCDDILFFDFPNGIYSIRMAELRQKAKDEENLTNPEFIEITEDKKPTNE